MANYNNNNNNNLYNMCSLVGAMDGLWFHQTVLKSQPNNISIITPQNLEELSFLKFQSSSFSTNSSSLEDEDIETESSPTSSDETNSPPRNIPKKETRLKRKSDSFNSSGNYRSRLEKSMSCRSLGELELEEVKGFLDLGFTFKREHMSPRMMSLIPGLQRINSMSKNKLGHNYKLDYEDEEDEKSNALIRRPYLSEAWLIRRPSSPLLNLKVPKLSQASDMKKHLRFWARTVASEIQQES